MPTLITVVLGAFLLLLVQPLLGKALLPHLGGVAAVWTACLLFFQAALLAGYAYAHWLARRPPRVQAGLHAALLLLGLVLLRAGVPTPVASLPPLVAVLLALATTVGLPYALLAATSPLTQAWQARAGAAQPYGLYAWSNVGSVVGLLAYPFVVEPRLSVPEQWQAWRAGYVAYALLMGLLAWRQGRLAPSRAVTTRRPPWRDLAAWATLAAVATALLAAVTDHLSRDVAPVPLLWVVPLAAYLLSFVVAFARDGLYRPVIWRWLLPVMLTVMAVGGIAYGGLLPARVGLPLFVIGLFVASVFCHGELARQRPDAAHATAFYLAIAAGGALGTLVVSVVLPALLATNLDLPLTLVACAVLAVRWLYGVRQPRLLLRLALVAALAFVAAARMRDANDGTRARARNFYGSLAVVDAPGRRSLVNGVIEHGAQWLDPARRREPTTYYVLTSGIGQLLSRPGPPRHVGIVGLGAGSLAVYGRAGDRLRFYELNPQVTAVARRWFTYLSDTPAAVTVVHGDARLALAAEPSQRFDVLAVDAFAGDAVPLHLVTVEALQLYRRHLAPGGVLALHVTNRYVDLPAAVGTVAASLGWPGTLVIQPSDEPRGVHFSLWALLADQPPPVRGLSRPLAPRQNARPWTDGYGNVLGYLR